MQRKITWFITGMAAMVILIGLPSVSYAVYSPTVYQHLQFARKHLAASKAQNGVGTAANAWDKWNASRKAAKAADPKYPDLPPAYYDDALKTIKQGRDRSGFFSLAWNDAVASFKSLFGNMSACLRDDIYEVEDAANQVGNELIRTAILFDTTNYNLLKEDYLVLQLDIDQLRNNFKDTAATGQKPYLFPDGGTNYYLSSDCPKNEFKKAWKDFRSSMDYFVDAVKNIGKTSGWGTLEELKVAAQKRADKKKDEWLAKNQLKLTLGGETGGDTTSLRKAGIGLGGIQSQWNTLKQETKSLIGPIIPLVDLAGQWKNLKCVVYRPDTDTWQVCTEDERKAYTDKGNDQDQGGCQYCINPNKTETTAQTIKNQIRAQQEKEKAYQRAEMAISYHLRFKNIEESANISFDSTFALMNNAIQDIYDERGKPALPTIIDQMSTFQKTYCKNKQ